MVSDILITGHNILLFVNSLNFNPTFFLIKNVRKIKKTLKNVKNVTKIKKKR